MGPELCRTQRPWREPGLDSPDLNVLICKVGMLRPPWLGCFMDLRNDSQESAWHLPKC